MSGTLSQLYGPQFAGGVFQVACEHIGPSIIESILRQFPRRKVQRGDMYADGARNLLRTNLEIIDPAVQANIKALLQSSVRGSDSTLSTTCLKYSASGWQITKKK
jgi:hypothetical protein